MVVARRSGCDTQRWCHTWHNPPIHPPAAYKRCQQLHSLRTYAVQHAVHSAEPSVHVCHLRRRARRRYEARRAVQPNTLQAQPSNVLSTHLDICRVHLPQRPVVHVGVDQAKASAKVSNTAATSIKQQALGIMQHCIMQHCSTASCIMHRASCVVQHACSIQQGPFYSYSYSYSYSYHKAGEAGSSENGTTQAKHTLSLTPSALHA